MKNRDRIIAEIKRQKELVQDERSEMQLHQFIEDINRYAEARWTASVWRKFLVVFTIVFVIALVVLPRTQVQISLPFELVYILLFGGFIIYAWLWHAIPKWIDSSITNINVDCRCCNYELYGLDSILGEDLWVGPEICPECGHTYPAIG